MKDSIKTKELPENKLFDENFLKQICDPCKSKLEKRLMIIKLSHSYHISEMRVLQYLGKYVFMKQNVPLEAVFKRNMFDIKDNQLKKEIVHLLPEFFITGWFELKNLLIFMENFQTRINFFCSKTICNFLKQSEKEYLASENFHSQRFIDQFLDMIDTELINLLDFSSIFPLEAINKSYNDYLEQLEMEDFYKNKDIKGKV